MSWDSYVDNLLQSGNVTHAALLGIDGSIWAKDAGCNLTQEEATAIAGGMGEVSGKYFQDNGCVLGGEKYFCLRMVGDEGLFYGKKGPSGLCIARSTQCLVIGVYGEGQTPGACNIAVEGMKVADLQSNRTRHRGAYHHLALVSGTLITRSPDQCSMGFDSGRNLASG
ncbi:Profilin [Diplonema papillatum]|nr:Profilin [Diplonema papillatum]